MSVSWLPLVADYSRYAKKPRSGSRGTFWGYFIGGTWMYAVGLLVALTTGSASPDQMVIQVMGEQGFYWAVAAVVLVLISTVTTTFLDIFSTVVSAQNLWPRFPDKLGNLIVGALGIVTALVLDVFVYEPFLLAIGAIFLPAFTVVLVDYYFIARRRVMTSQITAKGGSYWYTAGFNWRAVLAWAIGFVVYDWARGFTSIGFFAGWLGEQLAGAAWAITIDPLPYGASLPCIIATGLVYLLLVRAFGSGVGKKK
jgi:purine-cytosine permease-like protein